MVSAGNNKQGADDMVGAVLIGVFTAIGFLINAVVSLVVRCWEKHRHHPAMRAILFGWLAGLTITLPLLLVPGREGAAVWGGVSLTTLALVAAAIAEIVLDHRLARSAQLDEDVAHHLGPW